MVAARYLRDRLPHAAHEVDDRAVRPRRRGQAARLLSQRGLLHADGEDFDKTFHPGVPHDPAFMPFFAEPRTHRSHRRSARRRVLSPRQASCWRVTSPIGRRRIRCAGSPSGSRATCPRSPRAACPTITRGRSRPCASSAWAAELTALYLRWLTSSDDGGQFAPAVTAYEAISSGAKSFILKIARVVNGKKPFDGTAIFGEVGRRLGPRDRDARDRRRPTEPAFIRRALVTASPRTSFGRLPSGRVERRRPPQVREQLERLESLPDAAVPTTVKMDSSATVALGGWPIPTIKSTSGTGRDRSHVLASNVSPICTDLPRRLSDREIGDRSKLDHIDLDTAGSGQHSAGWSVLFPPRPRPYRSRSRSRPSLERRVRRRCRRARRRTLQRHFGRGCRSTP